MIPFTAQEQQLIERLSVVGGWDNDDAKPLKAKIKPYLLARTSNCCCYCRRSMHHWHGITIDIEHVLPKGDGKFPQFTFEIKNLSVSCKRCNMGIKGSKTSFYLGAANEADPFKSEHYEFIHPNLDVVDNHLEFLSVQYNGKIMVMYQVVNASAKGSKTYEYFELRKLELNSFDEAQGLDDVSPSESLPPELARELKVVLGSIQGVDPGPNN
jgi:uncharacterized protein (TIGR02646 family)